MKHNQSNDRQHLSVQTNRQRVHVGRIERNQIGGAEDCQGRDQTLLLGRQYLARVLGCHIGDRIPNVSGELRA